MLFLVCSLVRDSFVPLILYRVPNNSRKKTGIMRYSPGSLSPDCSDLLFQYISAHGGHTNAYTGASNTNYYFSVSSTSTPPSSGTSTPLPNGNAVPISRKSPLPRALEMFASFFHSPLFSDAGTARELNAVDSEHKKNSQSDRWRIFQLEKGLSGDLRGAGKFTRPPLVLH